MHFLRLSDEEADAMLRAAGDPAYREMNRIEADLAARHAAITPDEGLRQLVDWLRLLTRLGVKFEPNREPTVAHITLL